MKQQHPIARIFNQQANALVRFSQRYGRPSWLLFLLLFTLIVTLWLASPGQAQIRDVESHWARSCIMQLRDRDIIKGYPDGTFRPNQAVTRAEFAALVNQAFPNRPVTRSSITFRDVPANFWGRNAIAQAYRTNFLTGYPNRIFNPSQAIPRVQVLIALAAGLDYTPTQPLDDTLGIFRDRANIPDYARNNLAAATEKGLVVNYPNVAQLNPNQQATRGEVAAFFCQALGLAGIGANYVAQPQPPTAQKPELRGVWLTNIDSDVLFSQGGLRNAIATLDQLNFNTLYPTVWNWGYTLYPSQVAQQAYGIELDPAPGLQNRDMLQEIIAEGHQRNMAVIPWFEFGFMAPADSTLAQTHPQWLTQRRNGETIWLEGGVHERVWLNPLRPDVQQFITNLAVEIVSKYDVDGIQFDDHFGFPSDFGYDEFTVNLYRQEHNNQNPPADPKNAEWIRWRADKITDFMGNLFTAIKAANPQAIISLSPNPQEFSLESYLLDWQTWERKGLIEELIVQIYRNDNDRFQAELAHSSMQQSKNHIPVAVGVLSGLKGRFVPLPQIESQVKIVRDRGFAGVSFFFYESLWNYADETPTQRQAALQQLFSRDAPRPRVY
ncbi:MAG: family 10 glycosylhydrolase [Jaaginema sp. PMC 1079.18]|nr:family 10 glycosylhydrolase [Jaaginema sp. PMC 1080.18]MEC4851583.1 family 10 glycosylhydrolase [Jaaginema sp. PMC 1079.18]MEC4866743.1 family 10 glycosylhydrolase [Jaaginema sp. PMC 1078.18]